MTMIDSHRAPDAPRWNADELAAREDVDAAADELFPLFCSEMDKLIDAFERAAKGGDGAAAARLCHRLKGSAAIYGFRKFAAAVAAAEDSMRRGEMKAAAYMPGLLATSQRIKSRDTRTSTYAGRQGGDS